MNYKGKSKKEMRSEGENKVTALEPEDKGL